MQNLLHMCTCDIFFWEKWCLDNQPFPRMQGDLYHPHVTLNVHFLSFPNVLVLVVLCKPDVIYGSSSDILHRIGSSSTGHHRRDTRSESEAPFPGSPRTSSETQSLRKRQQE